YYIGAFADDGATTSLANYNNLGAPKYLSKQFDSGGYLYRYVVHDTTYYNASLGYRFGTDASKWLRRSTIRTGIVNFTDRRPPLASGSNGYYTSVYGVLFPGRTW